MELQQWQFQAVLALNSQFFASGQDKWQKKSKERNGAARMDRRRKRRK
jgi:hypothetical protein